MNKPCGCENYSCGTFVDTQMNESVLINVTDNMGRLVFWEDIGRPIGE